MTSEERKALAAGYVRFAYLLVSRYLRRFPEQSSSYDDLVGDAFLALVKAANGFDPTLGFAFGTYAGRAIWSELNRRRRFPLPICPRTSLGTVAAPRTDAGDRLDREETARRVSDLLDCLKPRSRRIFESCVLSGRKLADVGAEFGISKERVRQIREKAAEQIREAARKGRVKT